MCFPQSFKRWSIGVWREWSVDASTHLLVDRPILYGEEARFRPIDYYEDFRKALLHMEICDDLMAVLTEDLENPAVEARQFLKDFFDTSEDIAFNAQNISHVFTIGEKVYSDRYDYFLQTYKTSVDPCLLKQVLFQFRLYVLVCVVGCELQFERPSSDPIERHRLAALHMHLHHCKNGVDPIGIANSCINAQYCCLHTVTHWCHINIDEEIKIDIRAVDPGQLDNRSNDAKPVASRIGSVVIFGGAGGCVFSAPSASEAGATMGVSETESVAGSQAADAAEQVDKPPEVPSLDLTVFVPNLVASAIPRSSEDIKALAEAMNRAWRTLNGMFLRWFILGEGLGAIDILIGKRCALRAMSTTKVDVLPVFMFSNRLSSITPLRVMFVVSRCHSSVATMMTALVILRRLAFAHRRMLWLLFVVVSVRISKMTAQVAGLFRQVFFRISSVSLICHINVSPMSLALVFVGLRLLMLNLLLLSTIRLHIACLLLVGLLVLGALLIFEVLVVVVQIQNATSCSCRFLLRWGQQPTFFHPWRRF